MKNNRYLLAFLLGLALVLSGAAGLSLLGRPFRLDDVTRAQAAGLPANQPVALNSAAGYSIDWYTIDGGGGETSAGGYSLTSVISQPDAGTGAGGSFTLQGGFLPGTLQPWQMYLPLGKK